MVGSENSSTVQTRTVSENVNPFRMSIKNNWERGRVICDNLSRTEPVKKAKPPPATPKGRVELKPNNRIY